VTWTDELQTYILAGQFLVVVAAAVFGWRQLSEAKKLREDQTQPFVVVDLVESGVDKFWDLEIKNIGATMARDVHFEFDPALQSSLEHVDFSQLRIIQEGLKTLAPGKKFHTSFDFGPSRYEAGLPDIYEVRVTYRGPRGSRVYNDTMHLDVGLYWNRSSVRIYRVHDIYKEIKKLREGLPRWLRRSNGAD
jgi:hypothetical protein